MESSTFPWATRWVLMASSGCWTLLGLGLGLLKHPRKGRIIMEKERQRMEKLLSPKRRNSQICFHQATGKSMQGKRIIVTYFHHLCFWGLVSPQVVPETALDKAATLLATVMKEANSCRTPGCIKPFKHLQTIPCNITHRSQCHSCKVLEAHHLRDYAFKLRPISMSADLIQQLKACSVKLGVCADTLQKKINHKCDKNKHYVAVIAEAKHSKLKIPQDISVISMPRFILQVLILFSLSTLKM